MVSGSDFWTMIRQSFPWSEETGELTGMLAEYFSYTKDCLGNQILEFHVQAYDDYDEMLQTLQDREIDMIFYVGRNPNLAEKNGYALTNTAWTYSLMAVTDEEYFNEDEVYSSSCAKGKRSLKTAYCVQLSPMEAGRL